MPKYLLEVSYTLDGIRNLRAQGGSARQSAAATAAESVGGTLDSFFFAFGGNDVYLTVDLPDNGAAAALAMAVASRGWATVRTVVLLTAAEIDAAVAREVGDSSPGS